MIARVASRFRSSYFAGVDVILSDSSPEWPKLFLRIGETGRGAKATGMIRRETLARRYAYNMARTLDIHGKNDMKLLEHQVIKTKRLVLRLVDTRCSRLMATTAAFSPRTCRESSMKSSVSSLRGQRDDQSGKH
jgi:hypothetical protein